MAGEQRLRRSGELFGLCVLVALGAALVCVFGLVAMYQHGTGAYAVRYGRSVTLELPDECTEDSNGASCHTKWTRQDATLTRQDGSTGPVPFLPGQAITVHFSDAGWSQYDHYYTYPGLGTYERGGKDDPTDVTLAARAFGHDAYVAIGYQPTSLTSWGRHRLTSTVWWSLLVGLLLLVAVAVPLAVDTNRAPADGPTPLPGPAGPGGTPVAAGAGATAATPRLRPHSVSVGSRNARIEAKPEGLSVEERVVNRDGTTTWRKLLELEWDHIARVELVAEPGLAMQRLLRKLDLDMSQVDHRRLAALRDTMRAGRIPASVTVALYVHQARESKPRRLLDTAWLGTDAWESVADAVAANTAGRLTLDLAFLASVR